MEAMATYIGRLEGELRSARQHVEFLQGLVHRPSLTRYVCSPAPTASPAANILSQAVPLPLTSFQAPLTSTAQMVLARGQTVKLPSIRPAPPALSLPKNSTP